MKKNLVNKLQSIVKSRSVNSLGNIYPDEISEWLGVSNHECQEFIKELHDQRTSNAVRDNVLFEYGLFMGALGKERVCFVCKDQPKVASDLKGITYIDGNESLTKIKLKLKDWVNAI